MWSVVICELGQPIILQQPLNFICEPSINLKLLRLWIHRWRSLRLIIPIRIQIFLQLCSSNHPLRTHYWLPILNKILFPESLWVHPSQRRCCVPLMGNKILISGTCNHRSCQSTMITRPAQIKRLNSPYPVNPIASILVIKHLLLLYPCFPRSERKRLYAKFHERLSRLDVNRCLEEIISASKTVLPNFHMRAVLVK